MAFTTIAADKVRIHEGPHASLGEGPIWVEEHEALYWTDILNARIFRLKDEQVETYDVGINVSAIAWTGSRLIAAANQGVYVLNENFQPRLICTLPEPDGLTRTNDGAVGPDGCFWIGTMALNGDKEIGSLYRVTPELEVITIETNRGIPNTFAWDSNADVLYHADSMNQKMYKYDFSEIHENRISKSVMLDLAGQALTPDGSCIDVNNRIWNAQWDGWRVAQYNRHGDLLTEVKLPIPRPTSCCFGGENLCTLFITSARTDLTQDEIAKAPHSGSLLSLKVVAKGSHPNLFRIAENL